MLSTVEDVVHSQAQVKSRVVSFIRAEEMKSYFLTRAPLESREIPAAHATLATNCAPETFGVCPLFTVPQLHKTMLFVSCSRLCVHFRVAFSEVSWENGKHYRIQFAQGIPVSNLGGLRQTRELSELILGQCPLTLYILSFPAGPLDPPALRRITLQPVGWCPHHATFASAPLPWDSVCGLRHCCW